MPRSSNIAAGRLDPLAQDDRRVLRRERGRARIGPCERQHLLDPPSQAVDLGRRRPRLRL